MIARAFPLAVCLLAGVFLAMHALPPAAPAAEMTVEEFGRIPVVYNGRVKPVDTFARNLLRIISEKETFQDAEGRRQPAVRWLLDMTSDLAGTEIHARSHQVFRIVDMQLLQALGLRPREGYRYALDEFGDRLPELADPVQKAHERQQAGMPLDSYERHLLNLERHLNYFSGVSRFAIPHWVPPSGEGTNWETLKGAFEKGGDARHVNPNAEALARILQAYAAREVQTFNEEVATYLKRMEKERPAECRRVRFEASFNRFDAFNQCKVLYLLGFALSCLAWLVWGKPLSRAAYALLWLTLMVHTLALVGRLYLSGRPPITNLYSSAIFIGWGSVLLSLILERFYRLGVGTTVASVSGFATLLIAHILAAEGDTMEVLQAVLDTQFWLATHVTCITAGYATTYVAGLIGLIYIVRGFFTPSLTVEVRSSLSRMIYGTVCFATFFSFVGTVLGGLWADDSWGRFWGWDPKENGALMIVLWNALILHARWGGLVRERGLAVLAVFGNIMVSWSWFGVNELGVGLHSYGFTEGRGFWLLLFVLSQFVVIGLGLLPGRMWRSPDALRSPETTV